MEFVSRDVFPEHAGACEMALPAEHTLEPGRHTQAGLKWSARLLWEFQSFLDGQGHKYFKVVSMQEFAYQASKCGRSTQMVQCGNEDYGIFHSLQLLLLSIA